MKLWKNPSFHFLFCDLSFFRVTLSFMITRIQVRWAVIPQIGRRTWLNGIFLFGSEITRLTGELLADTTQTARYIQITCEPHLKTSTSSESHPRRIQAVKSTNLSTSEEMNARIARQGPGIGKVLFLCISTVHYALVVILTEVRLVMW